MLVTMSDKELNRINVIQAVSEKRLRRRDAAAQLELTERQVQRLVNRYFVSDCPTFVSQKAR
ncbi:Homeodomain-like domain-containing protein [Xenorhabdus japonica]|uniref:Homeodomain-like domain-containing protein n=1 Tax=Xenorhabdus japonica TaxID=53341 RepID=A0A1I5DED2_9GAMM|nr:Homeodomain-like domain-containing protein [Xenorhabdus japonica]